MSYMFEVYYKPPADPEKEAVIAMQMASFGGHLDYREDAESHSLGGICLTYEFCDFDTALKAANVLRRLGEHVEGPVEYGP